MAATRVTRRPRLRRTDPLRHHSGRAASASSPSGLTPGPSASAWATSTCRHLTRSGMPPGGDAGDLRHGLDRFARGEVALVSGPVGRAPARRRPPAARSSRASCPPASRVPTAAGRPRAGEVVQRRERRAVGQPRSGLHDVRRCRRGSGAPPDVRRGARGPAARPTASRSAAVDPGRTRGQSVPAVAARRLALCHRSVNHGAARRPRPAPRHHAVVGRHLVGTEHDVRRLPRHHVVQPLAGLRLDVGRVGPPLATSAQLGDPLLLLGRPRRAARRCRCAGRGTPAAGRQRDREQADDEREHRCPTGEAGPVAGARPPHARAPRGRVGWTVAGRRCPQPPCRGKAARPA